MAEFNPDEFLAEQTFNPDAFLADDFAGASVIEPVRAVGSAIGSTIAGGIAGTLQALNPFAEEGEGARTVKEFQEGSFQPTTEAGKQGLETLGALVQKGVDIVNFPISGLAGLTELITTQGLDQAVNTINSVQEKGVSSTAGQRVFEETGSPLAATIAEVAPEAILSVSGFKPAVRGVESAVAKTGRAIEGAEQIGTSIIPAAKELSAAAKETAKEAAFKFTHPQLLDSKTGLPTAAFSKALESKGLTVDNLIDDIPALPDNVTPKQAVNLVIKDKILSGAKDDSLAQFKLSKIGAVESDTLATEAIRQGVQRGDVQLIKTASPETKVGMREILKKTRQIKANTSLVKQFRPTDVAGDALMKRFTHIRGAADDARLQLDNIADTQLSGTQINLDEINSNFASEMNKLDINLDTSTIPPKVNFEGSLISKDRTSQRVVKDVIDLLSEPNQLDALRAHKLKRQLDNMIDFRKKSAGGLTEAGRKVAKSVRKSLNNAIRDVSDDYADVNDILSQSITTLDDFQKVLGPSIDVFKVGAEKAIGQDLKGLLSTRKTRIKLENSVNDLDSTAKSLGGKFNDDISDLVSFAEILDDQFGAIAKTGFKGQIGSAVKQAARGREGIKEAVIEKGVEAIEKARGINEQNAFKSIKELLKETK